MTTQIILGGCGALGSRIALNIVQSEMLFVLIDYEKVDKENIPTSAYDSMDIGRLKTVALYSKLVDAVASIGAFPGEHKLKNKKIVRPGQILSGTRYPVNLIIDAFDNGMARNLTAIVAHDDDIPVVHVGVSPQGIGSIEWNDVWQRMDEVESVNDVCTHEVGRNLILLTSTVASIIINKYLQTGIMEDAYVDVDSVSVYR